MAGLTYFRKIHSIIYETVYRESNAVSDKAVTVWSNGKLQEFRGNYLPKNIFLDGTSLFFDVLPSTTLAFKENKCHGRKSSKMSVVGNSISINVS